MTLLDFFGVGVFVLATIVVIVQLIHERKKGE